MSFAVDFTDAIIMVIGILEMRAAGLEGLIDEYGLDDPTGYDANQRLDELVEVLNELQIRLKGKKDGL